KADFDEAKLIVAICRSAARPIYCEDSVLALPWITQYPAYIYDDYGYYHLPALKRGILKGTGIPTLIESKTWKTLILYKDSPDLPQALSTGYHPIQATAHFIILELLSQHP